MKTHALTTFSFRGRSVLILAFVTSLGAASAADAATSLYLAFGVHPDSGQLVLRDLHEDHYHTFTVNNGTPGGHTPVPLEVTIGSATGASFTLIAANHASPVDTPRLFPEGVDPHLHLVLESLSLVSGSLLEVSYQHEEHTDDFAVGDELEIHADETTPQSVFFALPAGAAVGQYEATFRLVDESATNPYGENTFRILVNGVAPVPEPSAALLGGISLVLGLRRRR